MSWEPNTTQEARQQRALMLQNIRSFFYKRKVLEVETPALSLSGNTDPFIESFQFKESHTRYLHTSPEYPMKRLLAAGSGDIYQVCKVWREGESGRNHNPEFTLLEWYRVEYSYHQLIEEVEHLLLSLLSNSSNSSQFLTYESLFLEKFDINPHIANYDELISCAAKNISGLSCDGLDQQGLLDALLTHCIEPDFSKTSLTFIYDYPVSQSALAQVRPSSNTPTMGKSGGGVFKMTNKYPVAERFEVYFGTKELGNGYQEEVSFKRNKEILQQENEAREQAGINIVTEDKNFLAASEAGIPRSAGVAIGLDRVLMCILGVDSIQDVINFPWDKA